MSKLDDDAIITEAEKIIADESETPARRAEACVEKFQCMARKYKLCPNLLEKALEWQPDMPAALVQMGVFYRLTRNKEKAQEYLDTVIQIAPSYAPAWLERGNIYKDRGEKEKANADYNTYLQLNPNDPIIYDKMGYEIYSIIRDNIIDKKKSKNTKEDFDKAIFYYSEAIKHDPLNSDYLERRGELYLYLELRFGGDENFISACKDIEEFLTLCLMENNTQIYTLQHMFDRISRKNKKRYFSKMINDLPYGSDAYWLVYKNLADAFIGEKGSVKALNLYATMIEKNNTGSTWQLFGYTGRAELYEHQGEYDKALNDYAAIIQLVKEDDPGRSHTPIQSSAIYMKRAWIYKFRSLFSNNIKKDYTEEIIAEYSAIINMNKANTYSLYTAYKERAEIYKKQGEYEKALADYSAIIEGDDNGSFVKDAYRKRMNFYLEKGDKEKAFLDFIKMTESKDGIDLEGFLDFITDSDFTTDQYEILSDDC
jgi:tetratricopeptide (TPR) repeat protein